MHDEQKLAHDILVTKRIAHDTCVYGGQREIYTRTSRDNNQGKGFDGTIDRQKPPEPLTVSRILTLPEALSLTSIMIVSEGCDTSDAATPAGATRRRRCHVNGETKNRAN